MHSGVLSPIDGMWGQWAVGDSNLWPPVCKTGALTAELTAPHCAGS